MIRGFLAGFSGSLGLKIMAVGVECSMVLFQDQYQGGANHVFICKSEKI